MMNERFLSRLTMMRSVYNLWLSSVANVTSRKISGLSSVPVIRFIESETASYYFTKMSNPPMRHFEICSWLSSTIGWKTQAVRRHRFRYPDATSNWFCEQRDFYGSRSIFRHEPLNFLTVLFALKLIG